MHKQTLLLASATRRSLGSRRLDAHSLASVSTSAAAVADVLGKVTPPSSHIPPKLQSSAGARSSATEPASTSSAPTSSSQETPSLQERLPKRQKKNMIRITEKLIARFAGEKVSSRYGWHHTETLRSEEKRLERAIKFAQTSKAGKAQDDAGPKSLGWAMTGVASARKEKALGGGQKPVQKSLPSLEKETFSAVDGSEEPEEGVVGRYPLGTFVETRRNEIASHGVVIGEKFCTGRVYCVCLMSTGEIWAPNAQDVYFSIPSLVPLDLAARCGSEEITERKPELHARVEVLRRLRIVEHAVEDMYNVVCSRSSTLYEQVRHPDLDTWSMTTVDEVARLIDDKPSLTTILAVHKYLMNNPAIFIVHHDYRSTQAFRVVPLRHVQELETIQEWSRIKHSPLDKFAVKAGQVFRRNAKRLKKTLMNPPTAHPAQHEWDENDRLVLRFMIRALRPYRSIQSDPYALCQSVLLKKLGLEGQSLRDNELHMALVNLGVLAPWHDLVVLQPALDLDLEPENKSQRVREQNALVEQGLEKMKKAASSPTAQIQGPLGPEDFYPADPLESVRHDFGDMKVYVIDDTGAHELDDGISIERIPNEPGNVWIHVHIADPGSVIPPSHALAVEAHKRQETFYFFHRTWPLFPRSLMHSPAHGLSLGSGREQGIPQRVLTFSFKIDAGTNMLDYKVRAGLIRNIKVIDYDSVDRALGLQVKRFFPFGRDPNTVTGTTGDRVAILEEELKDLRDLLAFANLSVRQRAKNDIYMLTEEKFTLTGLSRSITPNLPARPSYDPMNFSGFPSMEYSVERIDDVDSGSRRIIAEAAKLACRVASRFALDQGNLPVLRRHVPRFVPNSEEDLRKLMAARSPDGYVENYLMTKYVSLNPAATYTLLPKEHFGLGIPDGEGYLRTTSPLRRYSDLVTHWQLHHALLGSRAVSRRPPFSEDDLEKFKLKLSADERLRKVAQQQHEKFWQMLYIQRWLDGTRLGKITPAEIVEGGDPMERLQGRTLITPILSSVTRRWQTDVHVPQLGLRGMLELPDWAHDVEIGTKFDLKMTSIRLGVRPQMILEVKS
ncbi:hypothetical protein AX17_001500 [Amanita inopinata Kibby_2008]|nr:hypothetical protein AX17_001500 [Amanita inopinata Kibby_2008]